MSASKLEKTVVNLERRLREEFQLEIQRQTSRLSSRLLALEVKLNRSEINVDFEPHEKESEIHEIVEESLDAPEARDRQVISLSPRSGRSAAHVLPEEVAENILPVPAQDNLVKPELEPKEDGKEEDPEEPVSFMETAWNLVLVLGLTSSGRVDVAIACLLLLSSAGMQITFSVILLGKDFLGDAFREQIDIAKDWRRSVAHDHKHMDLAQTSLISRVCNNDGKLILSTDQASLLSQINAFLGLESNDFELPWLQPGILLCMLCILLWCLYLCQELRAVFFSLEAVSYLPRGKSTILQNGRFLQMSYTRFYAYCLMRLSRLAIAVALLYAGVLWLAGTTSITDLILNAVALSAILQVDEMVFAALMPKKIQINIQDLEALRVRYSNFRSQFESVVLLALICGFMLWPYFSHVGPLATDMLEVKRQYCYGNQDFVVGANAQQQVTIGLKTKPFPVADTGLLTQFAVEDFIWKPSGSESNYIMFRETSGSFQEWLAMPMSSYAAVDTNCEDWSDSFLSNKALRSWEEPYRAHWHSTSFSVFMDQNSTCSDMKDKCDDYDSGLLRFMCGKTCGCNSPYSNPWWRVTQHGCSGTCIGEAEEVASFTVCEDMDMTVSPWREVWVQFWTQYRDVIESVGIDLSGNFKFVNDQIGNMTVLGCAGLQVILWGHDVVLNTKFCEGSPLYYRGLAYFCPVSCGCSSADPMPAWCPRLCEGCKDAEEFPPQGTITSCAAARAAGLCEAWPEQALQLCAETCELCHLLGNSNSSNSTRRLRSIDNGKT
eukprot:s977_g8.t1